MSICEGPLTSLAFCWRIERSDGAGLALTSHDHALVRGGDTYAAEPGVTPAAISRSLGVDAQSAEAGGAFNSAALTEEDLMLGRWDGARLTLSAIDWTNPDGDALTLLRGELGEIAIEGEKFSADLLGASARLDAPPCPVTSPECRAEFGDKQCRVDLAGRRVRARVVSSQGCRIEIDRAVDARFAFGSLRYLSGANCGLATTVLSVDGDTLMLRDRPRRPVEPGTRLLLAEGCDKRFATCVDRFSNAANFRGEPHLPGNDLLTRYPGA